MLHLRFEPRVIIGPRNQPLQIVGRRRLHCVGITEPCDQIVFPARRHRILHPHSEWFPSVTRTDAVSSTFILRQSIHNHYCIAAWGTARSLGRLLEQDKVVKAVEQVLEKESVSTK